MSWTKLGDSYLDDAFDLSDGAWRLHTEALIYSNRRLLDLTIPKRELLRFTGTADPETFAKELVDLYWWDDRGDVWWIGMRWPEWQRDRSQVEHRRAQLSLAQRRRRRHLVGDHSLCLHASTDDSPADYGDDPGRVWSGLEKLHQEEEQHRDDDWPDRPLHEEEA